MAHARAFDLSSGAFDLAVAPLEFTQQECKALKMPNYIFQLYGDRIVFRASVLCSSHGRLLRYYDIDKQREWLDFVLT